ncbi:vomeronasal type-2 receptor 26-like [Lissotriton helveticus]
MAQSASKLFQSFRCCSPIIDSLSSLPMFLNNILDIVKSLSEATGKSKHLIQEPLNHTQAAPVTKNNIDPEFLEQSQTVSPVATESVVPDSILNGQVLPTKCRGLKTLPQTPQDRNSSAQSAYIIQDPRQLSAANPSLIAKTKLPTLLARGKRKDCASKKTNPSQTMFLVPANLPIVYNKKHRTGSKQQPHLNVTNASGTHSHQHKRIGPLSVQQIIFSAPVLGGLTSVSTKQHSSSDSIKILISFIHNDKVQRVGGTKTLNEIVSLNGQRTVQTTLLGQYQLSSRSQSGVTQASDGQLKRFVFQNYQWVQAMVFAIEEINRNPDLLPNITLGFQIYDSCGNPLLALQGTLWMLTGQGKRILNYRCQRPGLLTGIVGDASSFCSIPLARVLGLYRHPQISYFATSPVLSDRNQFPSFFRTIPSDFFQSHGLAQLVIYFDWTWVGIITEDNDYGHLGAEILQRELHEAGVCVAFSENIILTRADRNVPHIVKIIQKSAANAVVVFGLDSHLVPLFDEIVMQNITGKTFIASEAWSTSALLSADKYFNILSGTIGLTIYSGEMPGFKEYVNNARPSDFPDDNYFKTFWATAFGCRWQDPEVLTVLWDNKTKSCTGEERIDSISGIYNELHHYIKRASFKDEFKKKDFFDSSGNPLAQYDIVHWQLGMDAKIQHRTVGRYDSSAPSGRSLHINSSTIVWPGSAQVRPFSICTPSCPSGFRKAAKEGLPACCFSCIQCSLGEIANQTDSVDCFKCPWNQWPNAKQNQCILKPTEFLSYEESLGTSLTVISLILSAVSIAILVLFIHYRNTPIVKANNRSLSYLLLLSLTLCFLCSVAFIGYPTEVKCLIRQVAFGISFALCISCILAKTIMVIVAFNATKPNSDLRRWVGPQLSYSVISGSTLIQVLLCASWLIISPPTSEFNIESQPGFIIIQCNEGSPMAFWGMLGYLGLLASISFIVAFMARKLPNSFNEAKLITFSMLAFLSVWLSFIPAYLSTKGKYMVALESFAILSSTFSLIFCIFVPKCYFILLKPAMNTKESLMGREERHRNKIKETYT